MAKKINQAAIAEQVGVEKATVFNILEGNRNPNTQIGMQILLIAASQYAEQCKAEYISAILRKWRLAETIAKKRKYNKNRNCKAVPKPTMRNRFPNSHNSGHKGVYWDKANAKWFSKIYYDNKYHFLGYFVDKEKAAEAYMVEKQQRKLAQTNHTH